MNCKFCDTSNETIIAENELAQAFYDRYPVSPGHALVVPRRHVVSFFEASEEEIVAIYRLLRQVKVILDRERRPLGYNIGVNVGRAAGQSVMHLHWHLIPRYRGDTVRPLGGVRNIVPYQNPEKSRRQGDGSKLLKKGLLSKLS